MCVTENTSQPASVESRCRRQSDSARSRLSSIRKSGVAAFSTVSDARLTPRIFFSASAAPSTDSIRLFRTPGIKWWKNERRRSHGTHGRAPGAAAAGCGNPAQSPPAPALFRRARPAGAGCIHPPPRHYPAPDRPADPTGLGTGGRRTPPAGGQTGGAGNRPMYRSRRR